MSELQQPEKKREIKIQYPAEMYDKLVDGLAFRFGWREEGVPAQTPTARNHPTYNQATNLWKPEKREFAIEAAVMMVWQQAMEGYAARQAQAAQQATVLAFQAAMDEARGGGHLSVVTADIE